MLLVDISNSIDFVTQRLDQLREKGNSPNLIHHLAEDAQEWAELRSILRSQVCTARDFAVGHCRRYNEDKGLRVMQKAIDSFSDEVNDQISQPDQTVKDILQFVSIFHALSNSLSELTLVRSLPGSQLMRLIDQRASQQA